jgi:hypothetical protein
MNFEINPKGIKNCFVAYIDLLGFTELVMTRNWIEVFVVYEQCLEQLHQHNFTDRTQCAWFSDTFILYTNDDSVESFSSIELKTRFFVDNLISEGIMLRGALSVGEFYADSENQVFFGKVLIDAYRYAENQKWIGYIFCPSTLVKMDEFGLEKEGRLNYVYTDIPFKEKFQIADKLLALRIGENIKINGRNRCLDKLREVRARIVDENICIKYDLTIDFIEKNQLLFGL